MYNDQIMNEKQYLSKEKFNELSKELEQLKTEKRKEIAEKLEFAKSLGDLSENAEYQEARDEQAKTEDRILNLETILKSAEIVTHKEGELVSIGSRVTICKAGQTKEQIYYIVGSEEVDMTAGKISDKSPLGGCLLNKKKGDTFLCKTPKGEVLYTIIDVK